MTDPARARRLAGRIHHVVADALQTQIKDPRLGMATITDVRLTPDLRDAKIYYTVWGDDQVRADTHAALVSATGILRSMVGQQTGVKFTPSIAFVVDQVPDNAHRIDELLTHVAESDQQLRQLAAEASPAGDEQPYKFAVTMSDPGPEMEWDRALAVIRSAESIVLAGHINPDADALGSMLAFGLVCENLGIPVVASFSEPLTVPDSLSFLPGQHLLVGSDKIPAKPDVFITFDTGSVDRLGTVGEVVDRAVNVIVIDHHASNTRYGTCHLIDPAAAATAVLVDELLDKLGAQLTADIAACLYAALITDTGSFRFASTDESVHQFAGRLLSTGIDHESIARSVYDTRPYAALNLISQLLAKTQLEPQQAGGAGLVWTYATNDDLIRNQVGQQELESLIDIVRTTAEAEVACVMKQLSEHEWAVSLRSKGLTDVGAVSVALGGGGHKCAAGFTGVGSFDQVIDQVRRQLAQVSRR